jgi:nitroreductase
VNRRKFIRVVGSSALILGLASTVYTTRHTAVEPPYTAWKGSDTGEEDLRLWALGYAILAPNPHNLQPWRVDISKPDELVLYHDLTRVLPQTDPYHRQLMIGHGCFIECLRIAAQERGVRLVVQLFEQGEFGDKIDARPIARIRFIKDSSLRPDPLFQQLLLRHTNRQPYALDRVPESSVLASICQRPELFHQAAFCNTAASTSKVKTIALDAWKLELNLTRTWRESVQLTRIGSEEIQAQPDGVALDGRLIQAGQALGLISREKMLQKDSWIYAQSVEFGLKSIEATAAFVWLSSADNQRHTQIECGRDYLRMQLTATELGLAMQPVSQSLQEYPEMTPHFNALRQQLQLGAKATVQMLARIGYAEPGHPSPRWPVRSHILST